eukprot:scaffold402270_cov22-Prasinocladus_malaysianus.AAC.1
MRTAWFKLSKLSCILLDNDDASSPLAFAESSSLSPNQSVVRLLDEDIIGYICYLGTLHTSMTT